MGVVDENVFPKLILDGVTSDPAAPSNDNWKVYAKPGGIYARSSNSVVGPFAGGVATDAIFDAKGDLPVGTGADTAAKLSVGSNGYALTARSSQTTGLAWEAVTGAIEFVIDGGGSTITTGVKGYLEVPFACTITAARMFADQSGSIVVDVWKDTYANYPPVDADSITASAPPTISSTTKSQDTTLTGWTTTVSAGDVLGFNVDSCTSIQRCIVSLRITRT